MTIWPVANKIEMDLQQVKRVMENPALLGTMGNFNEVKPTTSNEKGSNRNLYRILQY